VSEEQNKQRVPMAERPIAGVSTMGWATILAVVAVVFVVTFANLRGMALRENESHVQALLRAIGDRMSPEVLAAPPSDLRDWTDGQDGLAPDLTDVRWVGDEGDLLLRHGYLVEWRPATGGPMLVAWPTEHGLSGNRAFAWSPVRGLVELATPSSPWSGLERRPGAAQDLTPAQ